MILSSDYLSMEEFPFLQLMIKLIMSTETYKNNNIKSLPKDPGLKGNSAGSLWSGPGGEGEEGVMLA